LRAVPPMFGSQFPGVIAMGLSTLIFFALPWLDRSTVKSIRYRGTQWKTWFTQCKCNRRIRKIDRFNGRKWCREIYFLKDPHRRPRPNYRACRTRTRQAYGGFKTKPL
ncbi:MAG: hypothetical protein EAZ48_05970, partial [Flavobacteriia bacterium]